MIKLKEWGIMKVSFQKPFLFAMNIQVKMCLFYFFEYDVGFFFVAYVYYDEVLSID